MEYRLENERLLLRAQNKGAELTGVLYKDTGEEMLWQANPAVWGWHAPLLFPYCGRLYNSQLVVDGQEYPAPKHGFARTSEFACTQADGEALVFRLVDNDKTRETYPFLFALEVAYRLEGNAVIQTATVYNTAGDGGDVLPFNLGFHPALALPFSPGKGTDGYEIAFSQKESPVEIETPDGYLNGKTKKLFENRDTMRLHDDFFAQDSICMSGLHSSWISLRERESGRENRVWIEGFPYVLLWGIPKGPLPFVCIEPWHGLPDGPAEYDELADKPGITLLAPGEKFETVLKMEFFR